MCAPQGHQPLDSRVWYSSGAGTVLSASGLAWGLSAARAAAASWVPTPRRSARLARSTAVCVCGRGAVGPPPRDMGIKPTLAGMCNKPPHKCFSFRTNTECHNNRVCCEKPSIGSGGMFGGMFGGGKGALASRKPLYKPAKGDCDKEGSLTDGKKRSHTPSRYDPPVSIAALQARRARPFVSASPAE